MKQIQVIDGLVYSLWCALVLAAAAPAGVTSSLTDALSAVLFWGAVYGGGLWYARNHEEPPPKQWLDIIAAIGLLVFILGLFAGHLVQALMSLLLWLQAARTPALSARRDVYFALLISLTLIIFAASEAKSNWFLLLLLVYGLVTLTILAYCHQQQGMALEHADSMELAGLQGASWGSQHYKLPRTNLILLAALVFIIALGWYLLVPRPKPIHFGVLPVHGGVLYSRADWENEAWQALHPELQRKRDNLGRNNQTNEMEERLNNDQEDDGRPDSDLDINPNEQNGYGQNGIVMYVDADRPLYLRRRSFDYFENNRWYASRVNNLSMARKLLPIGRDGKFELPALSEGVEVKYSIHVVSIIGAGLPLSAHAKTVLAPAFVIAQADDGTVFLPAKMESGFRYSAVSVLPTDQQARPVINDILTDAADYLQLPMPEANGTVTPRIAELTRTVTASLASPLDQAVALEQHLRNSYAYSFKTIFTSQNLSPLDEFLFVTKRGHCEFFASAMAVMLREIGIPSRVVHGYLAHNYNPIIGLYEVRSLDGHAWVEAYIEGKGWMTFEPTAAYPKPLTTRRRNDSTLQALKDYTEKLQQQEPEQGQVSLLARLAALLRILNDGWHAIVFQIELLADLVANWLNQQGRLLAFIPLAAVVALSLIYKLRVRLLWAWAKMLLRFTPAARIPLVAVKLLEKLAETKNRDFGKQADETVDEYLLRLESACPCCSEELQLLISLFNAVRYGGSSIAQCEARATLQAFYAVGSVLASA